MKEYSITLNTDDKGHESFETELLMGKLDCIVIGSDTKFEIIIESKMGYIIFHKHEHYGTKYYPIRARTHASEENLMDVPNFEKFNLNEPLIITVIGRKNQQIDMVFRLE